jgi:RNA polymerase sigma-70 factor (ECF subfamily)
VHEAHLDDAAQDVFLVVNRKLEQLTGPEVARAWVMGIAYRVASDYRRRIKRQAGDAVPETLADPRPDPQRSSEIKEGVSLLHSLLAELDADKRPVFVLVELEQLSVVEAAEALNVNLNTAHARLRAARALFEKAHQRHLSRREHQVVSRRNS